MEKGSGSTRQWCHPATAILVAQQCISHELKAWHPLPWWCCPHNTQIPFLTEPSPWQVLLVPWVGEEHRLWANIPVPTAAPPCGLSPSDLPCLCLSPNRLGRQAGGAERLSHLPPSLHPNSHCCLWGEEGPRATCPPVPAMQRFPVLGVKTTCFTLNGHWGKCTGFPQSMEQVLLFSTWALQWHLETRVSLNPLLALNCSSKTLLMLFCVGRAARSLLSCGKSSAGKDAPSKMSPWWLSISWAAQRRVKRFTTLPEFLE